MQHTTYQANRICKWLQKKTKLEIKEKIYSDAFTLHAGRALGNEASEIKFYD